VLGGRVEGDPGSATAQLLAGWLSTRCGCPIEVEQASRRPGPSGVDTVSLQLDQDEEVQIQADRRGGAIINQPFRPGSTVALPERSLGDLVGEELRHLDPDEPFQEALETATGVHGLDRRSPVREHVWFDPADPEGSAARVHGVGNGHAAAGSDSARQLAPTVPPTSEGTDEVALNGEHDEPEGDREADA
jgi:hypothetical protein